LYAGQPLEGNTVSDQASKYKLIVLTRRLHSPGVLETMSEQVPEVRGAFSELQKRLDSRMNQLGEDEWTIVSHSHNIYNSILILSVLVMSA
jgi:hypothetical protein